MSSGLIRIPEHSVWMGEEMDGEDSMPKEADALHVLLASPAIHTEASAILAESARLLAEESPQAAHAYLLGILTDAFEQMHQAPSSPPPLPVSPQVAAARRASENAKQAADEARLSARDVLLVKDQAPPRRTTAEDVALAFLHKKRRDSEDAGSWRRGFLQRIDALIAEMTHADPPTLSGSFEYHAQDLRHAMLRVFAEEYDDDSHFISIGSHETDDDRWEICVEKKAALSRTGRIARSMSSLSASRREEEEEAKVLRARSISRLIAARRAYERKQGVALQTSRRLGLESNVDQLIEQMLRSPENPITFYEPLDAAEFRARATPILRARETKRWRFKLTLLARNDNWELRAVEHGRGRGWCWVLSASKQGWWQRVRRGGCLGR